MHKAYFILIKYFESTNLFLILQYGYITLFAWPTRSPWSPINRCILYTHYINKHCFQSIT